MRGNILGREFLPSPWFSDKETIFSYLNLPRQAPENDISSNSINVFEDYISHLHGHYQWDCHYVDGHKTADIHLSAWRLPFFNCFPCLSQLINIICHHRDRQSTGLSR